MSELVSDILDARLVGFVQRENETMEIQTSFAAGDEVICGCDCHKGQKGIVKSVSKDGSLVSISLSHDDIAIPTEQVTLAKATGDA